MTREQAETANKAKTDFLSNMTYEIKTPVILISSLCDELINMPVYDERTAIGSGNYIKTISFNNVINEEFASLTLFTDVEAEKDERFYAEFSTLWEQLDKVEILKAEAANLI